jgi:hypothetical protein
MTWSLSYPPVSTFDPEETDLLSKAVESVCSALRIPRQNKREREVIAARIVDLARSGLLDVMALRNRILLESRAVI